MTPPRHNVEGATWLVTRRCSERRFFLRPDGFVARAILFILGHALAWFSIKLNAAVVLSNHWHLVITDLKGKKSQFFRLVHMMIARSVNTLRGRFEAFWAPGRPNMVRLMTPDDILDKMVYVMLNPVRANLVEHVDDWPGLVTLPEHFLDHEFSTKRPNRFFDKRGPLGSMTRFRLTRPPGFDHLSDQEFVQLLRDRIAEGEAKARQERGNKKVLGAVKVLCQHWNSKPKTRAPRFQRVPEIACRDRELRIAAIEDLLYFRTKYRAALGRFCGGARNTVFPYGTLNMRRRFRVRCRPNRSP